MNNKIGKIMASTLAFLLGISFLPHDTVLAEELLKPNMQKVDTEIVSVEDETQDTIANEGVVTPTPDILNHDVQNESVTSKEEDISDNSTDSEVNSMVEEPIIEEISSSTTTDEEENSALSVEDRTVADDENENITVPEVEMIVAEENRHTYHINHAIGAVATASDTEVSYWGADKAIDGIINRQETNRFQQSRWSTNRAETARILTVDLLDVKDIDSFVVNWERTNVKGFQIAYSLDGIDYTTVYEKTDDSYVSLDSVIPLNDMIQARYVKLIVNRFDGGEINWASVSLYEFQIIGPASLENFAYQKMSESSGNETNDFVAAKAYDGNDTTRWASNVGHDQKTLQVDLKEAKQLASVVIDWERKNATRYKIEVSDDKTVWRMAKALDRKPSVVKEIINFDHLETARYVRLVIENFDARAEDRTGREINWATVSVFEMEVYDKMIVEQMEQSLHDIGNDLSVSEVSQDMKQYVLPTVPKGVQIEFIGADFEQIIDYDLTIHHPLVDTTVQVNYRLRRGDEVYETPAYDVLVRGLYESQASDNEPLYVIPALAEWKGGTGKLHIPALAHIVVSSNDRLILNSAITAFQKDYELLSSRRLEIVEGTQPQAGDFYFVLQPQREDLKDEGYSLKIDNYIKVEASHAKGIFYSTQTLLQVLKQNATEISKGEARDYPKYQKRGFVLDVGRKPVKLSTLKDMIKALAWYKYNDFQLHLNDNYIWVEDFQNTNDPYGAYSAFRLESNIVKGSNSGLNKADLTAKDLFYTKAEFKELMAFAKELGIQIVPEFDSPAHALALTKVRPDLTMQNHQVRRWVDHLEVSNPQSLEFVKSIWNEYLDGEHPVFENTDVIHLGVDEFEGNNEGFRAFTDALLKYAIQKGKTPRLWGSLTAKSGSTAVQSEGVEMNIWSTSWANPSAMYQDGYQLINTLDSSLYWVPGANYYQNLLNSEGLYNNWEVNQMAGTTIPAGSKQMLGAAFAIWNDLIGSKANGIQDYDLYLGFIKSLPALSSKMWSNRYTGAYHTLQQMTETIGAPLAQNPYHKVTSDSSALVRYRFDLEDLKDVSGNDRDGSSLTNAKFVRGKMQQGLQFEGGESYFRTPLTEVGPNNRLSVWVKLDSEQTGEQILSEFDGSALKLVQKDTGKVGFSTENYDYSFNYTLPRNRWVHLTFEGHEGSAQLYVNDRLVDTLVKTERTGSKSATLVLPVQYIGSKTHALKGMIDHLEIYQDHQQEKVLSRDGWKISSDNENVDGTADKAFDGDYNSIWHSQWQPSQKPLPASLTIDMLTNHMVDRMWYVPRKGNLNGNITHFKLYGKAEGKEEYHLLHEGRLSSDGAQKVISFPAENLRHLKLDVLDGYGGFASAAEILLLEADLKTPLRELILEAKAHQAMADKYHSESIADLLQVLPQAEAILQQDNVIVTDVLPVMQKLKKAIEALQSKTSSVDEASEDLPIESETIASDGTVELAHSYTGEYDFANQKEKIDSSILQKEYEIFPSPHNIAYKDGAVSLMNGVNIVIEGDLDIYTRNRIKSILQENHISYTTTKQVDLDKVNIILGTIDFGDMARQHQQAENIPNSLYDKIDAYSLVINNNQISIVGKDTDSVFYGLTTLRHILLKDKKPVVRNLMITDYADIKNRGFIEGYYGNPWSNEDRAELMRFGGELKMTQYFFAPKDDPYHNSRWRDLYPAEKLKEIQKLAQVGNQTKTRYVWTLHPFMNQRFRFDAHYEEDLDIIKNKFTQLMDVGVREFGILADDAPTPMGGTDSYNRLMRDLKTWLAQQQSTYQGLRKEMIFVPHEYWGNGSEAELRSLNLNLPDSSSLTLTGGKIWGQVTNAFLTMLKRNLTAHGGAYRPVQLWINWPCTDNSKQHLILGGGEKFLQPNVDPTLISGIMLNPMQQSEPSKIALFSAAEYTWKVWHSDAEAKHINDIAFNFVDHGNFADSKPAESFRELAKHMINQNMDSRVVKLEESVELAPKLYEFLQKMKQGEDITQERKNLQQEFTNLRNSAVDYQENGYPRMVEQIQYWLLNTIDQMDALTALLKATEYVGTSDQGSLWKYYKQGLDLYNQSKTHRFWYVSGYQNAELGVQHIRPFIQSLLQFLAEKLEASLDPSQVQMSLYTNRKIAQGNVKDILDGKSETKVLSTAPASIAKADYIGLLFDRVQTINSLGFAMGTEENKQDTFSKADIEYLGEDDQWHKISVNGIVGNEDIIELQNLNIVAKGVRLLATGEKGGTWLGVREIAINRPLLSVSEENLGQITHSNNLIYKLNTGKDKILDGNPNTEAMFANANRQDTTPVNAWVQLDLGKVKEIENVLITQGNGDKLERGVVEYLDEDNQWYLLQEVKGEKELNITTHVKAKAIRIKNTQQMNKWWRISRFKVESKTGVTTFTDTNVEGLKETKTYVEPEHFRFDISQAAQLQAGEYIGLKLDRLHETQQIVLQSKTGQVIPLENLSLMYSANLIEWYSADQLAEHPLARYIRVVNQSKQVQTLPVSDLIVTTKEVIPPHLHSTTFGIHASYGSEDVRNRKNFSELFDRKLNTAVQFSDFQRNQGTVVIDLGEARKIEKIRAYIQDGTINYLRDGKIQISSDAVTWTDVITVGDGVSNQQEDNSLDAGWTHDSQNPGNRYIEGMLNTPMMAKYLRILITADYNYRFLELNEIVINDGEFIKPVNDPTVETTNRISENSMPQNIVDHKVLSSYKVSDEVANVVYHLSENTNHNHINILSSYQSGQNVKVKVRVANHTDLYQQDVPTRWLDLGVLYSGFAQFALPEENLELLDVSLSWENQPLELYEVKTYYEPLEDTNQNGISDQYDVSVARQKVDTALQANTQYHNKLEELKPTYSEKEVAILKKLKDIYDQAKKEAEEAYAQVPKAFQNEILNYDKLLDIVLPKAEVIPSTPIANKPNPIPPVVIPVDVVKVESVVTKGDKPKIKLQLKKPQETVSKKLPEQEEKQEIVQEKPIQKITLAPTESPIKQPKDEKQSKIFVILSILGISVVILGGVIFFLLAKRKREEEEQ